MFSGRCFSRLKLPRTPRRSQKPLKANDIYIQAPHELEGDGFIDPGFAFLVIFGHFGPYYLRPFGDYFSHFFGAS